MHTDIRYGELPQPTRDQQAMRDLKEWFGIKKYQELTAQFRTEPKWDKDQFHNVVSIAGVRGYPVDVWYKVIWPDNPMG